jgi:serine/threonine protein kinase
MLAISENASLPELKSIINNLIEINKINRILMSELILLKLIGEGAQSKVYEGYYNRSHCAIKILHNIDYKSFMSELVILSHLNHPSIPKFYGIVFDDKNISIVTEYIKGENLDHLKLLDLNYDTKMKIIKEIGNVLEYMHVNHMIHRDLKPGNIIIDNNYNIHLIDFGIAKICANKKNVMTSTKGTLNYLAPESFEVKNLTENEEVISIVSPKVDVWAFGCLVSYIFSGEIPWEKELNGNNSIAYYKNLINQKNFPIPSSISNDHKICELIRLCTIIDENRRIAMTEVNDIIFKYDLDRAEDQKATFG